MNPPPSDLEALVSRVGKLERQNRWIMLVACAAILFTLSVLIMAKRGAGRLITSDLILQDPQGHKRAELSMDKDSQPNLVLFNLEEGRKATLGTDLFDFQEDENEKSTSLGIDGLYTYDD